jgi:hypothetical protein
MKFINNPTKKLFITLALFSLLCNLISSVSIKNSESKNSLKENEVATTARAKTNSKRHIFKPESNPPIRNNTNNSLGFTFEASVNNSVRGVNLKDFKSINSNSRFNAMFDKQLEEIFLIFKNKKFAGVSDFRNSYAVFIKNFNTCDKDNNLLLDKNEFSACMNSDPYLSIIQQPLQIYSVGRNFTNATAYNYDIFNFANNYDVGGLNIYDYVMIRLFAFAWRKCTISNNFMDESSFECAIDIISGAKSLNTNTLRSIFKLGLNLLNTKSMPVRTLDFFTYYALGSSIRLFFKINTRGNLDARLHEFNVALDNNILPTRYNQDIINQLYRLTGINSSANNGIDMFSFVYYDHFLKLFYQGATANRWKITSDEFNKICSSWLFPQNIFNGMTHVPTANITESSFNLRSHINQNQFDEEDNFYKFLEIKANSKNRIMTNEKMRRYNETTFNLQQVDQRIFTLLDSNSDQFLTFYDFGNFVQTFSLYYNTDSRNADRVIVGDIGKAFQEYSDLPMYSSEFKARSNRFNLIDQDLYIDPYYTLAITRMDDYVQHYLRRNDPTTVKEVELNLILSKINLKNYPAAYLDKCRRGKDDNGIPRYDWECAIIDGIQRSLKYFEYTRDISDINANGLNMTFTQYDYAQNN